MACRKVVVGVATALLIAVWAAGIVHPASLLAEGICASVPALLMWLGAPAHLAFASVGALTGRSPIGRLGGLVEAGEQ